MKSGENLFRDLRPRRAQLSPPVIFQWPDKIWYTPSHPTGTAPIVPVTTDPAKLAIYALRGLTPNQPNNIIPKQLIDPNAVLEVNAGTFPHPNFGTTQYISSILEPTNVLW
jgi:hypothetical protein